MSSERLQKLMAQAGLGSRRSCEEIIKAGRVKVNGTVAQLGTKADPRRDTIEVDGKRLPKPEEKLYIMVHKPLDVLSDEDDTGEGRRTVREMVPVEGHLYPVGRLDKNSVGLILLTNDGEMAHRLTHPRYEHEKLYRVKVEGSPSNETLEQWRRGVQLDGGRTKRAGVTVEKRLADSSATWLHITMREGRKRQIRRVGAHLGHPVQHLSRTALGPLKLGDLPLGKWRHLTRNEVERLRKHVNYHEKRAQTRQEERARKKSRRSSKSGKRPRRR